MQRSLKTTAENNFRRCVDARSDEWFNFKGQSRLLVVINFCIPGVMEILFYIFGEASFCISILNVTS